MSEAVHPEASSGPKPAPEAIPGLYLAITWSLICLLQGLDRSIPSKALHTLYIAAFAAPFVFVCTIALRRRFFPSRVPVRWPSESKLPGRWTFVTSRIALFALLLFVASLVVGRHHAYYSVLHDGFYFLLGWAYGLGAYVDERKPLPPRAPVKPPFSWAGMKPLRSDHWGQPAAH